MSMMEEPWEEHQSLRDRLAEPETLIPILQRERRLNWQHRSRLQLALYGNLHTFQRLRINYNASHTFDGLPRITIFEHASIVREASICSLPPSLIILPWAQVTSFFAKLIPFGDCVQVLRMMPCLVDCLFGWISNAAGFSSAYSGDFTACSPEIVGCSCLS
jgi:hypothetical protein